MHYKILYIIQYILLVDFEFNNLGRQSQGASRYLGSLRLTNLYHLYEHVPTIPFSYYVYQTVVPSLYLCID